MPRLTLLVFVLVAWLSACGHHGGSSAEGPKLAPGFLGATAWLNVDHPLTLEELRGKVVVVDFWTSCCINCIHTLPVLAEVEKKFAGKPVVVVGVHSAKFDAEKEADRLREIVTEYSIAHPIAVDGSMKLWNAWGIQGWPTLLVLDATGHIVSSRTGETDRSMLLGVIQKALDDGAAAGTLSQKPVLGLRREVDHSGPLSFPGKVIALADGSLAVSDTGHNRVVVVAPDGAVSAVVGSGLAGFLDGGYAEASFRKPQGLATSGDVLYVADTENHSIRVIDLRAKTVATVAGTGELGTAPLDTTAAPARTTKLRSPWDLVLVKGTLYVALAGSHQIGRLNVNDGTIDAFAGDGKERRLDGAGMVSSFAQPSGLSTDGSSLFVADAESSSLRAVSLATRDVHTLVGQDLFVFGDVDGPAPAVRMEHPLGVAWGDGTLWIADTYNSKIKRFDPKTGVVRTLAGGRDHHDLFEPEGLSLRGSDLVVADTKHHRLEVLDTKTGALRTIEIRGLAPPAVGVALDVSHPDPSAREILRLGDVPLASHGPTNVHFEWKTVRGTGINEEAPFHVEWTSSDGLASVPTPIRSTGATVQHGFDLTVTPITGATGGRLEGSLDVVLCDITTHLVCVPVKRALELTFRVATAPSEAPSVVVPLPEAKP